MLQNMGILHKTKSQTPPIFYSAIFSANSLFALHLGPIRISSNISGNNSAQMPPQNVYVHPSPHECVMRSMIEIMMAARLHRTRFVHAVAPELRLCRMSILSVIVVFNIPMEVQPRNTPRTRGTAMCALAWIVQPHAITQTMNRPK
jgi:hypothetical protein